MSKRRGQLLRGGGLLMAGEAAVQVCGLVRNFAVARVVSPDQFGIAAALAMSVSLIEMVSDLGAGRYLTRSHGEEPGPWLAVAHGISSIRGVVGALALVAIAGPLAALMNMPQAAWAFRMIAVIPLLRGLTHHEIWLAQRELRFRAFVASQTLPQLVTALAAYPLALALPDFRALLWLLILNAALSVVLSHVVSPGPYRMGFHGEKFRKLCAFGLPLMGDGLLMFVVLHGERIVIANAYGPALLGAYSAAFLLAWTPAAVLGRVARSLGVPLLASLRHDRSARDRQYAMGARTLMAPALGTAVLFGVAGPQLVGTVFGSDYQLSLALVAWLGIGQALRMLRVFPTVLAVAEGHTSSAMLANIPRAAAVGVGWLFALAGQDPWVVLAVGAGGELLALTTISAIHFAKLGVRPGTLVLPLAAVGVGSALAWAFGQSGWMGRRSPLGGAAVGLGAGVAAGLLPLLLDPNARRLLVDSGRDILRGVRRGSDAAAAAAVSPETRAVE